MRTPEAIPDEVRRQQRNAADPKVSSWLAANAGSGKTHVLAQRVINLLLDGVEPEKILCLTFTKAAAANMAKRVFDTLAAWTRLDDAALDMVIREQSDTVPDAGRRASARRLFARALETPGGLKVQTIHAFCTQLLHQFPFEANVAARFTVLDETEHTQRLEQITLAVLLDGANDPEGPLGRALAAAMTAAADQTFREVVRAAISRRDSISQWVTKAGGVDAAIAALSCARDLDPADDRASIEDDFFTGSAMEQREWPDLATALTQGGKNDAEQAHRFSLLESLPRSDRIETYLDIFCTTSDRTPRKSIVTRAIRDAGLVERLIAEQSRVCALLQRWRAVICRDRSAALLTVASAVLTQYQKEKLRRGLLDYDDLIDKTFELLTSVDAAWVHYKLDLGIDHLLIDEAQDTSSKQWQIVRQLVAEFTAGAGARAIRRTIFAVGDEKQSIYSFQNAAPKEFAEMRRYFERTHVAGGLDFVPGRLEHSFRSGESILAAVDLVFKDIAASVTTDRDFPPHIALPDAPSGMVEIWEPVAPDERAEIEGWDAPFDTVSETSPKVKLAQRIARTVRRLVKERGPVDIDRRAARYGDVLVLVRQRGELFESVIRALKHEGVPVAGADRLMLTEHIAVMDLIALADALLLPEDDLALATVLRSPLFGFSDDDLFAVAWERGRMPLRASLRRKRDERQIFADADARLDGFAEAAREKSPFAFFADVFGARGGRRRFLDRLGPEANDALDEFLNLALDYERRETPSLQGFLAWLRQARAEVKRDMEIARDEVRVMTVHGAKGLEAPIVILADTMTPPAGPKPPRLLSLPGNAIIWIGRKADDAPPVIAARQKAVAEAIDEYRRLLYVGMTRAADRLIVCGADGERRRPDGCWYDLIHKSLEPFLTEEADGGEKVLRYRKGPGAFSSGPASPPVDEANTETVALPAWLREPAPFTAPRPAPLSPSSAFYEKSDRRNGAVSRAERLKALKRGRIVHRLLQSLPDIPSDRRKDRAERYVNRAAADFSTADRAEIASQVIGIIGDAKLAEAFTVGSRAEVAIVGRIPDEDGGWLEVNGRVDRLSITDRSVLVADYKTDSMVPRSLDEAQSYVAQLALYRAVLASLYPAKIIRAALIFTAGPRVMEVTGTAMDEALARLLSERHALVSIP